MKALLLLAALLVAALGGCLEQRTLDDPALLPLRCKVDADCAIGRVCEHATCVEGCRDEADCPAGEVCYEALCTPPGDVPADAGTP